MSKTIRCPACGKRPGAPLSRHRLGTGRAVLAFRCGCGRRFKQFTRNTAAPPAGPRPPTT